MLLQGGMCVHVCTVVVLWVSDLLGEREQPLWRSVSQKTPASVCKDRECLSGTGKEQGAACRHSEL